ncbi:MAG: sigma 54-interacting transcriptional regulator [Lentisphaerota bacterium]
MKTKAAIHNHSFIVDKLMELAYDGIVVVDQDGIITLFSKAYADFLGVRVQDVVGKHVKDVIPNTRLPLVLKTGKPEESQLQLIKGDYILASRIPLMKDGKIIGAIGKVLFRNIEELNTLHRRMSQLQQEVDQYRTKSAGLNQAKYSFHHIIGESDKMQLAKTIAEKASLTDSNVLLTSESGTGKELFAHSIHQGSVRSMKPFIKINCSAIPSELLESELFGYEEGAFTGARKGGRSGKFESADGGTLFLDEIGDMPAGMQAKLLRVLQEREVERIGAQHPVKVDVRIIAATNQNLPDMVEKGLFRADLYYRLNVIAIRIPPLRERPSDIDQLVPYLLEKICSHLGKYIEDVSPKTVQLLKSYSWPGNVRQLENILECAVNLLDGTVITPRDLPEIVTGTPSENEIKSMRELLVDTEKDAIIKVLNFTNGKKAKTARLLKISRSNLYERMNRLNLE